MRDIGPWILIGLAALVVIGAMIDSGGETEPRPAPDFSLVSLDGEIVSLSDHEGRVVLLDFWATWCRPCTRTFPALHGLQQRFADQGVDLLVVSLDRSAEVAREHLVEAGFPTFNVLWGSLAEARAVRGIYGVVGIPHTFLIDRDGLIQFSGYPLSLTAEKLLEVLAAGE
ncbi:MAG: TlpA disulfide reductase family protein [Candidatus Bipolaricaulia bacterium]